MVALLLPRRAAQPSAAREPVAEPVAA
jgi:hypothetical protein